jgi:hypothetical protein
VSPALPVGMEWILQRFLPERAAIGPGFWAPKA